MKIRSLYEYIKHDAIIGIPFICRSVQDEIYSYEGELILLKVTDELYVHSDSDILWDIEEIRHDDWIILDYIEDIEEPKLPSWF